MHRPREAIKHFPDLSDIVAEKRLVKKRWQRYRKQEDKVELDRLTNLIHKKTSKKSAKLDHFGS